MQASIGPTSAPFREFGYVIIMQFTPTTHLQGALRHQSREEVNVVDVLVDGLQRVHRLPTHRIEKVIKHYCLRQATHLPVVVVPGYSMVSGSLDINGGEVETREGSVRLLEKVVPYCVYDVAIEVHAEYFHFQLL